MPCGGRHVIHVTGHDSTHLVCNPRSVPIQGHDVSLVGRKPVMYHHFPASGLVEYRDLYSVAETADSVRQDNVDIFYEAVMTNLIVRYVVLDVFYAAVIPYGHIVKCRVIQSGMFFHTSREVEFLAERT